MRTQKTTVSHAPDAPVRGALPRVARRRFLALSALALLLAAPFSTGVHAAESVVLAPAPVKAPAETGDTATLVVAGGCFWGVQAVYQHVKGVSSAVSGYAGGTKETADYSRVSNGDTGHAEAVRITYDPRVVGAGELLRIFFSVVHDPTQKNRQGPDVGTQYRSAIFVDDAAQRALATDYVAQLGASKVYPRPIATTIEPLSAFYPAESYHQDYLVRHPDNMYIVINDKPKVESLKRLFPQDFRETPQLVGARS